MTGLEKLVAVGIFLLVAVVGTTAMGVLATVWVIIFRVLFGDW